MAERETSERMGIGKGRREGGKDEERKESREGGIGKKGQ